MQTEKRPKASVSEHRIGSLIDFVKYVENLQLRAGSRKLWFRGVGNIKYSLLCSLYGHPQTKNQSELQKLERDMLIAFEERGLPFLDRVIDDEWSRLFFMQHQGIPTRLLDWTENPFVSLFFAVESANRNMNKNGTFKHDCGVWVLDPETWQLELSSSATKKTSAAFRTKVFKSRTGCGNGVCGVGDSTCGCVVAQLNTH
jgi:hypothetical protein